MKRFGHDGNGPGIKFRATKLLFTREFERRLFFYLTLFMLGLGIVSKWM